MKFYIRYRGGSWDDTAHHVVVVNRDRNAPSYRYNQLGFRIVRSFE